MNAVCNTTIFSSAAATTKAAIGRCLICKDRLTCFEQSTETLANLVCLIVLCFVFSVTATVGNALSLHTLVTKPSLHNPSNFLLASLCLTDVLVGCLTLPIHIVEYSLQAVQIESCTLKSMSIILAVTFSSLDLLLATTISLDRCFAVCRPFVYERQVSMKTHMKVFLFLGVLSIAVALLFVFNLVTLHTFSYILAVGLSLCLIVIFICYCAIYGVVLKKRRRILIAPRALDAAPLDMKSPQPQTRQDISNRRRQSAIQVQSTQQTPQSLPTTHHQPPQPLAEETVTPLPELNLNKPLSGYSSFKQAKSISVPFELGITENKREQMCCSPRRSISLLSPFPSEQQPETTSQQHTHVHVHAQQNQQPSNYESHLAPKPVELRRTQSQHDHEPRVHEQIATTIIQITAAQQKRRKEKDKAFVLGIIIAALVVTHAPFWAISFSPKVIITNNRSRHIYYMWATFLVFVNSSLNPLIYCGMNSEIRAKMLRVLRRTRIIPTKPTPVEHLSPGAKHGKRNHANHKQQNP
eukprot:gene15315-16892_t